MSEPLAERGRLRISPVRGHFQLTCLDEPIVRSPGSVSLTMDEWLWVVGVFVGTDNQFLNDSHRVAELIELAEWADGYDGEIAGRLRDVIASWRPGASAAPKSCPETGGACQHRETCEGRPGFGGCWLRHARKASEPEGRGTGLHRDSMG